MKHSNTILINVFELFKRKILKRFKAANSDYELKLINNEIDLLKNMNNPFILKYLDFFNVVQESEKVFYLVTPFYQVNEMETIKFISIT